MVPEKQVTQNHYITGKYCTKLEELRVQHGIYRYIFCTKPAWGLHRAEGSSATLVQLQCNPCEGKLSCYPVYGH
jgi:hypothetical protein